MTTDRSPAHRARPAGRRRHAVASRIVAGCLSAVTSLVLVASLARSDAATPARRTDSPPALVVPSDPGAGATTPTQSAPPLTRSEAPPITSSQAS
jgi:hypothetical protein